MKQTPNQLFEQLSKEFAPKKDKELINEELGQVVTLKPINTIEASAKDPFWTKFENFLAEGGTLDPIVNTEEKVNTKEEDEKIKAEVKKVDKTVENVDSHNYDYKAENINNVNAQEVLTGIQCEINYNKELTLDEAKELAVKNLAKDPLHYVKEGQFGVKGLGYTEPKVQENTGETYGGSGFSEKLKDSSTEMQVVKEGKEVVNEAFGQVVTSGNPNSLAAQSGNVIRQMMAEKEEAPLPMDEMEDEGTAVSYSDTTSEAAKPDFADIDGDGDKEETMKQAAKDKKKKMKKESIDSKLAEIGKEAEKVKMEAQLDFLHDHIDEKVNRVNSIQEDENLSELIDKSKMKQMQREIKDLQRRKAKMERIYEKSCGSKYSKKEMVDEMDEVSWNDKNNPTRGAAGERDPKKVGQSTSTYAINEGYDQDGSMTKGLEGTPVWEVPKDTQNPELKPYAGKYLTLIGGGGDRNGAITVNQIEVIEKDPKKGWNSSPFKSIKSTNLDQFGKVIGYYKEDKSDPDYEAKKAALKYTMKPEDREKKQKVKAAQASGDFSTLTFKNKSGQEDNLQDNPLKYILSKSK